MKSLKFILAATILTVTTFALTLYSSCKKDPCKGITCLNGGACNDGKCICTNGYTGTYCETAPDPCASVVCQNGGTCNSGKCTCPTGYEGTYCETKMRDKFVGSYVGTEACTVGIDNYTLTLAANADALKLTMTNIYNNTPPYVATCTIAATDSFLFNGSQGLVTYSGSGKLTGGVTLTVRYTITDGAVSNSCVFTGTR